MRTPFQDLLYQNNYVLTPGGFLPTASVYEISPGQRLYIANDHLYVTQIGSTQPIVDLGPVQSGQKANPAFPENLSLSVDLSFLAPPPPGRPDGWVAYATWQNDSQNPIRLFEATWDVPPPPKSESDQTIYLFIGIQNAHYILQPVLQWEKISTQDPGAWTIRNWFVDRMGTQTVRSQPVVVQAGQLLGRISYDAQTQTYTSSFQGHPSIDLPLSNSDPLNFLSIALETYQVTDCKEYPNAIRTKFRSISVKTATGTPNLAWAPHDGHTAGVPRCMINSPIDVDIFYCPCTSE